jgi:hypothetical protein
VTHFYSAPNSTTSASALLSAGFGGDDEKITGKYGLAQGVVDLA